MEPAHYQTIHPWLRKIIQFSRLVDPRTVRLKEPGPHLRRSTAFLIALTGLLVGAAALATTRGNNQNRPSQEVSSPGDLPSVSQPPTVPSPPPGIPLPPNFYDPLYVFTDEPATTASAYPMADPPAIVVDIMGIPEPTSEAIAMVGKDTRVKSVKRRVTSSGVRYIVKLNMPIQRITMEHEGNVVIIAPVR